MPAYPQVTPASTPFPARTKATTITLGTIATTITSLAFADKLLLTLTQPNVKGPSHWIQVPLTPSSVPEASPLASDSRLLPMAHLTATTILGGGNRGGERDVFGQLLATQIASEIARRDSGEGRMLVLGLGLAGEGLERDEFAECVGACLDVL